MAKSDTQSTKQSQPEVTARLSYLRISPRKVRLVAGAVRGMGLEEAKNQLAFMDKKAALPMRKLLQSVEANAKNRGIAEAGLVIKKLFVDEGPVLKRFMPRAHGRASGIKKRMSHIVVVVGSKN
jgi:large subunit ribosomal protein L22